MLKKLYKYDWKSVSMLLLVLHGVLLAYSIIGRLAIAIAENFSSGAGTDIDTPASLSTTIFGMGAVAYILIYAIFIVGIVLATILYLAVRMQKSLFSDEGYLTNTLPVSSDKLLWSKILWNDFLCVALSILILVSYPDTMQDIVNGFQTFFTSLLGFEGFGAMTDTIMIGHRLTWEACLSALGSGITYLPERTYLNSWMKVCDIIDFFQDFYEDFDKARAYDMLKRLNINPSDRLRTMSKGTKEKVQLILVMSRRARLYCLDEPIAGVDPAARDYILSTIIQNYDENATIIISTHLISDVENILDDVVFIQNGHIRMVDSVENIRFNQGKSVDALFREVFKC